MAAAWRSAGAASWVVYGVGKGGEAWPGRRAARQQEGRRGRGSTATVGRRAQHRVVALGFGWGGTGPRYGPSL